MHPSVSMCHGRRLALAFVIANKGSLILSLTESVPCFDVDTCFQASSLVAMFLLWTNNTFFAVGNDCQANTNIDAFL